MQKVIELFRLGETSGEVGIEIEVEGSKLPSSVPGFDSVPDGSLRGDEAMEYVFQGPVPRDEVMNRLNNLEAAYKKRGTAVSESYRTSSHVHINVQQLPMEQVYNFIVLYMMFEEYLVKYCGEHREGNLYCLRVRDAEATITNLRYAAQSQNWHDYLSGDHLRYAAINVNALAKYGSLEFRSMRGTRDLEAIHTWVRLLLCLKDAAVQYDSPVEIIDAISSLGAGGLAEHVFGHEMKNLPLEGDWQATVFRNMQEIQDLAFATSWVDKKEKKKKPEEGRTNVEDWGTFTTPRTSSQERVDGELRRVARPASPRPPTAEQLRTAGERLAEHRAARPAGPNERRRRRQRTTRPTRG